MQLEENKKKTGGYREYLNMNTTIQEEAKKRKKNISMRLMDNEIAYHCLSSSCLIEAMKLYKVTKARINFSKRLMLTLETSARII